MSGEAKQSLESQVPDGRDADLLPTRRLLPDKFEDFTEDLLSAHKFVAAPARHVERIQRWGRRGDKQDGIDFEGTWNDGTTAAWQCKRLDKLTAADVHAFVAECTYRASEYYIVYSGEASSDARRAIKAHDRWDIIDQRGLTQMVGDLPLQKQRRLLDLTWGENFRRHFLQVPGDDSFLGVEEIADRRRDDGELINDLGPTAGRTAEAEALSAALDRAESWPSIVIVSGVGGIGKTRLMVHRMEKFQTAHPQIQVLWLSPGHDLDKDAIRELPLTPAVVVVDDAHRHVGDLGILLNYAIAHPDTQIVIGVRGLESQLIRSELIRAGFRQDDIREVTVGRLKLKDARALVTSISDGLNIGYALSEALAQQACDAPFMAVLTLNLIRRGLLNGHLALDSGLREQVMARYEDILIEGIDAVERRRLQRVLAALSALSTVDVNDQEIRTRIIALAGIGLPDYLQLRLQLRNRGILLEQSSRPRIVPELFADQVLEQAAVIDGNDTGFVAELWNALGDVAREDLFTSIGSLEWRLALLNGPRVMDPIWAAIESTIYQGHYGTLYRLAGHIGTLPLTQPVKTVEVLRRIHQRLDELDRLPPSENTLENSVGAGIEALFEPGEIDRAAVERRLAVPYGACAANEPEVLEEALDALWNLCRRDPRPMKSTLDHPCKIIIDQLCNVSRLPDPSYPARIISVAGRWLDEPPLPDKLVTPLAVVEPFLAKEGTATEMKDPRALSLSQFLINPTWARPHRDAIRALCLSHASDENLPLTAEIIRLLEGAVRPPFGLLGAEVTGEQRNSWADDDLATIAALQTIAGSSGKAVVRRSVRRAGEFTAVHASSPELKYAALSLLNWLDQLEADDLSGYLLGGETMGGPVSQRARSLPLLTDYVELAVALSGNADDSVDDFDARFEEHNLRVQDTLAQLTDSLWPRDASPKAGVQRLAAELHDALLMSIDMPTYQVSELFSTVVTRRPDALRGILEAILELPDGPVDAGLPILLDGLRSSDRAFVDSLVANLESQREGLRWALGRAAGMVEWTALGMLYTEAIIRGSADPSERVRQEFLAALPFADDPIAVAKILIDGKATDGAIDRILRSPINGTDQHWYRKLDHEHASAVLDLIAHLKTGTWEAENRIADIAFSSPRLVLDRLSDGSALSRLLRPPTYGNLQSALSDSSGVVADWILDGCKGNGATGVAIVLDRVVGERLPQAVTDALIAAAEDLGEDELNNLFGILAPINAWAAHYIDLARRLVQRSRAFSQSALDRALRQIGQHLSPIHWSASGPESPELRAALVAVEAALESETDEGLRELELEAKRHLDDQIDNLRREFEEDDE